MATSATTIGIFDSGNSDKIGFVVGRYFAATRNPSGDLVPDHLGISHNIEAALKWTIELWRAGYLVFTPHLNTHHFEAKTKIYPNAEDNERHFQLFDQILMERFIDFVFATPNWRQSSGGRKELRLAQSIDIPIFEGLDDLGCWTRNEPYATVSFSGSAASPRIDGGMKIVVVDGPYWSDNGNGTLDIARMRHYAQEAEDLSIRSFNAKAGCFTHHLNSAYTLTGYRIHDDRYHLLCRLAVERLADAILLIPEWREDPPTRRRVALAHSLGKPVFDRFEELTAWLAGETDYFTVTPNR